MRVLVRHGYIGNVLACQKLHLSTGIQSVCHFNFANCQLESQAIELASLRSMVISLQSEVAKFQTNETLNSTIPEIYTGSSRQGMSYSAVLQSNLDSVQSTPGPQHSPLNRSECKFNVVVYGMKENPEGTRKNERLVKGLESVAAIIQTVNPEINERSIHDCVRLGKYNKSKHRPVLVKLTCSHEVVSMLSNRQKLSETEYFKTISIK